MAFTISDLKTKNLSSTTVLIILNLLILAYLILSDLRDKWDDTRTDQFRLKMARQMLGDAGTITPTNVGYF